MTEFKNYNDWIEAYFDRRIIEVERNALEDEAQRDPVLAQKIKLQREALIALEHLGKNEAAASIHEVYQTLKKERAHRRSRNMRFASGFVGAMLLGSLAIWGPWDLFSAPQKEPTPIIKTIATPTASELVSDHIQSSPFQQTVTQLAPASGLSEASLGAISQHNYQPAIAELEARIARYPNRDDSKLLLAVCQLGANEPGKAAQQLIPMIEAGSSYKQQAAWYLALAYFQEGMVIQALGLMEQIAHSEGHIQQAEAQSFLNKLKGG